MTVASAAHDTGSSCKSFKDPDPLPRTQRARAKHARDVIQLHELFGSGQYVPWRLRVLAQTPDAAQRYAMTIANLAHQLAIFERYERRAWSKRKQAFERFFAEHGPTKRPPSDIIAGDDRTKS